MAKIVAVCISDRKGIPKKNIRKGILRKDYGLLNDAHAGKGSRQISLLAKESLDEIKKRGIKIGCGGFGENLTTSGIELTSLLPGVRLRAGESVLEITQIGKECKKPCKIYKLRGRCILPSQGIFARVSKGAAIRQGDDIEIMRDDSKIAAGVAIVSDRCSRGESKDASGALLIDILKTAGVEVLRYNIIPDDDKRVSFLLREWSDKERLDLIITSGGTGFSPRDITPEATKKIINKEAPGLCEMMRAETAKKTKKAYLSRGIAGIRRRALIVNLPGSPNACKECLEAIWPIMPHAVEVLRGNVKDCR